MDSIASTPAVKSFAETGRTSPSNIQKSNSSPSIVPPDAKPRISAPGDVSAADTRGSEPKTYEKTGIPSLDAKLQEIGKKPARKVGINKELAPDFPHGPSGSASRPPELTSATPTVAVVGAGWYFPRAATAFAAAGIKTVAYEANPHKIGKGQIGLTGENDYFSYYPSRNESQLMPDFSEGQLEALPGVIRDITRLPKYGAVMKKRQAIMEMKRGPNGNVVQQYNSLPTDRRISKREVIEQKGEVLDALQERGYLQIVPEAATIEMVSNRLEHGEAVFMHSGQQVNLKKMGMENVEHHPGFVKEFLRGDPQTIAVIQHIKSLQEQATATAAAQNIPLSQLAEEHLPHVVIVGGGPIAIGSTLDLLEQVRPDLLKVSWVQPEPKSVQRPTGKILTDARQSMQYREILGHVSDIQLSEDRQAVESFHVIPYSGAEQSEQIKPDLFVHTKDEVIVGNEKETGPFKRAMDGITEKLDGIQADKIFVRFQVLFPTSEASDIERRLTEPMHVSIQDDESLKSAIAALVERQSAGSPLTIAVNGNNFMTESLTVLAASMGFRGKFVQISSPMFKEERPEHAAFESRKAEVRVWNEVRGRSVSEGTKAQGTQMTLGLRHKDGSRSLISSIDVLINGAGKTYSTPLVEAMKELGYISKDPEADFGSGLYSEHPKLAGFHNFFSSIRREHEEEEEERFPSVTLVPDYGIKASDPWGWEEAFEFGRSLRQESTLQTR